MPASSSTLPTRSSSSEEWWDLVPWVVVVGLELAGPEPFCVCGVGEVVELEDDGGAADRFEPDEPLVVELDEGLDDEPVLFAVVPTPDVLEVAAGEPLVDPE